ncbi:MAG: hypothetical protein AB7N76_19020 [Planctomycetota bacterium]
MTPNPTLRDLFEDARRLAADPALAPARSAPPSWAELYERQKASDAQQRQQQQQRQQAAAAAFDYSQIKSTADLLEAARAERIAGGLL